MKSLQNYITVCDLFSIELKLFLHDNSSRSKNLIGGITSIVSFSAIVGIIIYFFSEFIQRKNPVVISNFTYGLNNTVNNIDQVPFLLRLTDNFKNTYTDPQSLYEIIFTFWNSTTNPTTKKLNQTYDRMVTEPCNLDKHFGQYRYLFTNVTDLNTYFCPKWNKKNYTLYGQYGDNSDYTFLHWFIRGCKQQANSEIQCRPEQVINMTLSNTYIDFITVDNLVSSIEDDPKQVKLKADRFPISNTVFKRIFSKYQQINFHDDRGYIFVQTDKYSFFQFHSTKEDIDLRNIDQIRELPGAFLWLTIHHTQNTLTYYRKYTKLQNFLADVGGIIKGITSIGFIFTYFISQKYFYQDMINQNAKVYDLVSDSVYSQNTILKQKIATLNLGELNPNNLKYTNNLSNNNNNNGNGNEFNENWNKNSQKIKTQKYTERTDLELQDRGRDKNEVQNLTDESIPSLNENKFAKILQMLSLVKKRKTIKLSLREIIFPFICTTKTLHQLRYHLGRKEIDEQLNMPNILNQLYQFKIFKKLLLDDEQIDVFDFLFSNPLRAKKPTKEFLESSKDLLCRGKSTIIDLKLVEQLKLRVSHLEI